MSTEQVIQAYPGWYLFILVVVLIIHGFLSTIPAKMAEEKGYSYGGFWALSFFLSFLIGLLIAALIKDKNEKNVIYVQQTNQNGQTQYVPSSQSSIRSVPASGNRYNKRPELVQRVPSGDVKVQTDQKIVRKYEYKKYTLDMAVQLLGARLMHDEITDELYAQMSICNVADMPIIFMEMDIHCYDLPGEPIIDPVSNTNIVNYIYQDMDIEPQTLFGDMYKIKLMNSKVRKIEVFVKRVMFNDDTVIKYSGDEGYITDLPQETLDSLDTEAYQFALDIIIDKLTYCDYASVEYLPKQHTGGIWSCCCGRVNKDEWSICCYCGRDKQKQFDILDVRYLNEIATQQLKEKEEKDKVDMKRREKERQQREESVTRAKVKRKELYERQLEIERKRKIKGIIIAVVVVVAFISILILLSQ